MVYACPWSDSEHRALALAVGQHGCRWACISRLGLVPGRSPTAPRLEFLRNHASLLVVPEPAPPSCVVLRGRTLRYAAIQRITLPFSVLSRLILHAMICSYITTT